MHDMVTYSDVDIEAGTYCMLISDAGVASPDPSTLMLLAQAPYFDMFSGSTDMLMRVETGSTRGGAPTITGRVPGALLVGLLDLRKPDSLLVEAVGPALAHQKYLAVVFSRMQPAL